MTDDPRLTPADGDRNPLEALADVSCQHTRHYAMCCRCAADAVRPGVERLRAELAEARLGRVAGQLDRIGDWEEIGAYVRTIEAELATERASVAEYQQQIGYLADDVQQAEAAIGRVRELHSPKIIPAIRNCGQHSTKGVCTSCETYETQVCSNITCCDWPCPTIAALDTSTAPESTEKRRKLIRPSMPPRKPSECLAELTQEAMEAGSYGEPAPPMRPVSVESPGNDGFRYEPENPQGDAQ